MLEQGEQIFVAEVIEVKERKRAALRLGSTRYPDRQLLTAPA